MLKTDKPNNPPSIKRNISFSFLSILSRIVIGFGVSIIIARAPSFTKTEVGEILYAVSLSIILSLIVDYGIDTFLIKEISSQNRSKNELCYFTGFRTFLALIVFGVLWIIVLLQGFSATASFLCITIGSAYIINTINRTYLAYFQSQNEFATETLILVLSNFLLIILITVSAYLLKSVTYIGIAYIIARSIGLFISIGVLIHRKISFIPVLDMKRYWHIAKASSSFAMLIFLATAGVYINTILLRYFATENPNEQVAYFQIGIQFVMAAGILPQVIGKGLLPILASKENEFEIYFKTNNILMSLGVLISIFVYIFSEKLILFVYGEKYIQVANILRILSFVIMMRFGMMYNLFVTVKGNNWMRVAGSFAMIITTVIGNIILTPKYGASGAAICFILSHISCWMIYFFAVNSMKAPILLGWALPKLFLITTLFVIFLLLIYKMNILFVLPIAGIAILVAIYWQINKSDRSFIINILKNRLRIQHEHGKI